MLNNTRNYIENIKYISDKIQSNQPLSDLEIFFKDTLIGMNILDSKGTINKELVKDLVNCKHGYIY